MQEVQIKVTILWLLFIYFNLCKYPSPFIATHNKAEEGNGTTQECHCQCHLCDCFAWCFGGAA